MFNRIKKVVANRKQKQLEKDQAEFYERHRLTQEQIAQIEAEILLALKDLRLRLMIPKKPTIQ